MVRVWLAVWVTILLVGCTPPPPPPTPVPPTAQLLPTVAPTAAVTLAPTAYPPPLPTPGPIVTRTPYPPPPPTPLPTASPRPPTGAALPPGPVLFYGRMDGTLWAARADGTDSRYLLGPPLVNDMTRWSAAPDGRSLAVLAVEAGTTPFARSHAVALWWVSTQGEARKVLDLLPPGFSSDQAETAEGALLVRAVAGNTLPWSPDSRRVAVVSAHEGQPQVYSVEVATSQATRVSDGPLFKVVSDWSPDAQWLVYHEDNGSDTLTALNNGLFMARADGSAQTVAIQKDDRLVGTNEKAMVGSYGWLTADTLVVTTRREAGGAEVRLVMTAGQQKTVFSGLHDSVYLNPARRRLVITCAPSQGGTDAPGCFGPDAKPGMWVYNADEDKLNQIATQPVLLASWAPGVEPALVYYAAPATAVEAHLRSGGQDRVLGPVSVQPPLTRPVWSPDGKRLALGNQVLTTDGQSATTYTDRGVSPLAWSAAGLLYQLMTPNTRELYLWDGNTSRRLLDNIWGVRLVTP